MRAKSSKQRCPALCTLRILEKQWVHRLRQLEARLSKQNGVKTLSF